jgi:hypothetical protein
MALLPLRIRLVFLSRFGLICLAATNRLASSITPAPQEEGFKIKFDIHLLTTDVTIVGAHAADLSEDLPRIPFSVTTSDPKGVRGAPPVKVDLWIDFVGV